MAEDEKAQYERLKRELTQALPKKRALDKQLAQLESQLYNLEGTYLTETAAHSGGNIIQGFENYLKQSLTRRKNEISDNDRVFSNSSLTSQRALDLIGEGEEMSSAEDSKQPTPGVTTVITVPPATRNQELSAAHQNKLNRDKEYQRRRRAAQRKDTSDEEVIPSSTRRTKRARMATGDTDD